MIIVIETKLILDAEYHEWLKGKQEKYVWLNMTFSTYPHTYTHMYSDSFENCLLYVQICTGKIINESVRTSNCFN